MKIRLVTFHTPKNYGAVLQAFSLMSYLKKVSEDVKIVDFNTEHLRNMYSIIKKPHSIKEFVKTAIELQYYPKKKNKFIKFERFVQDKLALTKRYNSFAELENENWENCIFVTGSDQVFNPNRIEDERKAFYLDFVPQNCKKISYAASFGINLIPKDREDEITKYLNTFKDISVRESSGIEIIKKLTGNEATEVLDPVFLNTKDFWEANKKTYGKKFGNYLLYYKLMDSPESDRTAMDIAKKKGLQLLIMADGLVRRVKGRVLRNVGPQEFLDLISGAEFVVTDSFHGIAFSLLFGKQFVFSDPSPLTAERGCNLLLKAGILKEAYLKSYDLNIPIDYTEVNSNISAYIAKSREFIENTLKSFSNEQGENYGH